MFGAILQICFARLRSIHPSKRLRATHHSEDAPRGRQAIGTGSIVRRMAKGSVPYLPILRRELTEPPLTVSFTFLSFRSSLQRGKFTFFTPPAKCVGISLLFMRQKLALCRLYALQEEKKRPPHGRSPTRQQRRLSTFPHNKEKALTAREFSWNGRKDISARTRGRHKKVREAFTVRMPFLRQRMRVLPKHTQGARLCPQATIERARHPHQTHAKFH